MLRKAVGGGDATYVIPSDDQDDVGEQELAFELRQVQPSRSGSSLKAAASKMGRSPGSRQFVAQGTLPDSRSQRSSKYLQDHLQ